MANVTIQFDGEEYRVPGPAGTEAQAYYTSDRKDAIGTARLAFKDPSLNPTIRRVDEFKNQAFANGQMKAMNAISEKFSQVGILLEKNK